MAKSLSDRARGEREWCQRSEGLERANRTVARFSSNADELNIHVRELHNTPTWVRAMAEPNPNPNPIPNPNPNPK